MTKRGIRLISDLRERSEMNQRTMCWHWKGAMFRGHPRIHTFDHEVGDKRSMSGPKAVWNIAHGEAPNGIPFRRCLCRDCVNPAHLILARDKAEMGAYIARSGKRKGVNMEQRRAAALRGLAAQGITPTPDNVVLDIRTSSETGRALAARLNLSEQTISHIRCGRTHKHLLVA